MSKSGFGTSACFLLTLLFVGLKLCDKINWSWWWVLAPLWGPWAIAFAVMGLIGTVIIAAQVVKRIFTK